MQVICIGGIHGVGKSTFCLRVASQTNFEYLSASKIINNDISQTNVSKVVSDISSNQEKLIRALKDKIKDDCNYILDCHFMLLNEMGKIERIPIQFFKMINPVGMVVLYDNPKLITERINKRDKNKFTNDFILSFQRKELDYAESISHILKIPFKRINVSHVDSVDEFIQFSNEVFI